MSCECGGGGGLEPLLVDLWWLHKEHRYHHLCRQRTLGSYVRRWSFLLHNGPNQLSSERLAFPYRYHVCRGFSCAFPPHPSSVRIYSWPSNWCSHLEPPHPHESDE